MFTTNYLSKESKKKKVAITQDNSVISMKAVSQPLDNEEKVVLHEIYNESIIRLARSHKLLESLKKILITIKNMMIKDNLSLNEPLNFKQFFIDHNASQEMIATLKMIKRHFFIERKYISTNELINKVSVIEGHVLKILRGLEGKLGIEMVIKNKPLSNQEIQALSQKAYVMIRDKEKNTWQISYYENKNKKKDVSLEDIDPTISDIPNVKLAIANQALLLRKFMNYHAGQEDISLNKVYISNFSRKKQNDVNNKDVGFVYATKDKVPIYFGSIYLDYRLLKTDKYLAMLTIIHESAHRFAFVNDRGYYYEETECKSSLTGFRPYAKALQGIPGRAMNNADSYAYFICDLTQDLVNINKKENLPKWVNDEEYTEKFKEISSQIDHKNEFPINNENNLQQNNNNIQTSYAGLNFFAKIALGSAVVGGTCYGIYQYYKYFSK